MKNREKYAEELLNVACAGKRIAIDSGELTFSEVDVINMLNHAPTAFDVDKVVEMLEEECFSPIDYPGYAVDIEKAIEIVEEGGVDGKERI